jgi:hypothetical protein
MGCGAAERGRSRPSSQGEFCTEVSSLNAAQGSCRKYVLIVAETPHSLIARRDYRFEPPTSAGPSDRCTRAAEALAEVLGVLPLGQAEDVEVRAVAVEGMAAVAQRQALAEPPDGDLIAAGAPIGRERHLVRPAAVDGGFVEFTSAVDHARTPRRVGGRRPRSTLLAVNGGKDTR